MKITNLVAVFFRSMDVLELNVISKFIWILKYNLCARPL